MNSNWQVGLWVAGVPLLLFVFLLWTTIRLAQVYVRRYPATTPNNAKYSELFGLAIELLVEGIGLAWKLGFFKPPIWLVILLTVLLFVRMLNLLGQGMQLLTKLSWRR